MNITMNINTNSSMNSPINFRTNMNTPMNTRLFSLLFFLFFSFSSSFFLPSSSWAFSFVFVCWDGYTPSTHPSYLSVFLPNRIWPTLALSPPNHQGGSEGVYPCVYTSSDGCFMCCVVSTLLECIDMMSVNLRCLHNLYTRTGGICCLFLGRFQT